MNKEKSKKENQHKRIHGIPSGDNRASKKHVGASQNCLCKGHLAGIIIHRRLALSGCRLFSSGMSSLNIPMAGGALNRLLQLRKGYQVEKNEDSKSSPGVRSMGFLGKCPLVQRSPRMGHEL